MENTEPPVDRARLKRAAAKLGWKITGAGTAEVKIERRLVFGPRTAIVRGRVTIELPAELNEAAGEAAAAELVDPAVARLRRAIERIATKLLTEPDDVAVERVYEASSFFSALESAQRGLVRDYEELANRRIDARVENDLGLRFYLESFKHGPRRFIYFAGPTNSGKTHAAIELLREASSGIYLAPLRLLALEVYERLREAGVAASLVTGEERIVDPAARHVSSTVEMADVRRDLDVAVIDEAQMLADEQRGWAWTLAVAGVRASTVVLCGSHDGLAAAQKLCAKLGIEIEVREFARKNKLRVVEPVALNALMPGDAVVAFSRSSVVQLQAEIGRSGRSTAAIYGSLSPAVRRLEAERFRSGLAQVLVATDAIGLGLNLPIRRMIFATVEKYDGVSTRLLRPPEIRQIAGRAGRYGMHEEGLVAGIDRRSTQIIRDGLERFEANADATPIWISPTDDHLRRLSTIIGTTRLSRLLEFFQTRVFKGESSDLRISDLSEMIDVAIALEMSEHFVALPLETRSTYSRAPVTAKGGGLAVLARWADLHARGLRVDAGDVAQGYVNRDKLLFFEDRSRLATLYLWLAQRFPKVYGDAAEVMHLRERTDADIQIALLRQGERAKRPKSAQKPPRRKGPPKFDRRRLPK